jgi:hypothetical protein
MKIFLVSGDILGLIRHFSGDTGDSKKQMPTCNQQDKIA